MAESRTVHNGLGERFANIRGRINQALDRSDRPADDVTLVAIAKKHSASSIRELVDLGATDIGENRVQEAEAKIQQLGRDTARWHLVGHLQANKARRAIKLFDVIHSIDSVELVQRLDRLCGEERIENLSVLIQVDLGGEETKSGIGVAGLKDLAVAVSGSEHLILDGLMTLPPFFDEAEDARPYFSKLAELRDRLGDLGVFAGRRGELSMGMSHDFEVAIEEGATMVRIGTAIFGERI